MRTGASSILLAAAIIVAGCTPDPVAPAQPASSESAKPNVLFIVVDDLNDWVGFLDHERAHTPHMDRFAETATVFTRAYAPGVICSPSRTAILTGKHAHNTGIYRNSQNFRDVPELANLETLPQSFSRNGYESIVAGKIFHAYKGGNKVDTGAWAFDHVYESEPTNGSRNTWTDGVDTPNLRKAASMTWGAVDGIKGMEDYENAAWAAQRLSEPFDKPFFLSLGISKPHLTWRVPQQFFDLHEPYPLPDEWRGGSGTPRFNAIEEADKHAEARRAYLAAVSYADYCVGLVLEALERSEHRDNTIVVVTSDHGWQLGEHRHYGKRTLENESMRVPLLVRVPGRESRPIDSVVSLVDLYPTLAEFCGLPEPADVDGRTFADLLADSPNPESRIAIVSISEGMYALVGQDWKYTRTNGVSSFEKLGEDRHENVASDVYPTRQGGRIQRARASYERIF